MCFIRYAIFRREINKPYSSSSSSLLKKCFMGQIFTKSLRKLDTVGYSETEFQINQMEDVVCTAFQTLIH